jgi:hypothetical protein
MGSWVKATFAKGTTQPIGSSASGTTTSLPWESGNLTHRGYDLDDNKTIYVRGHLLNDHLGGPSVPYNLVPLTGTETKSSANANKVHEGSVENMAKARVAYLYTIRDNKIPRSPSSSSNELVQVKYNVFGLWAGHNRSETPKMAGYAQNFANAMDWVVKNWNKLDPTVEDVRKSIHLNSYENMWTQGIKEGIDAVAPYDRRNGISAAIALNAMRKNAALWIYEDQSIPTELLIELISVYEDQNEVKTAEHINNALPSEANTPYVKSGI